MNLVLNAIPERHRLLPLGVVAVPPPDAVLVRLARAAVLVGVNVVVQFGERPDGGGHAPGSDVNKNLTFAACHDGRTTQAPLLSLGHGQLPRAWRFGRRPGDTRARQLHYSVTIASCQAWLSDFSRFFSQPQVRGA